MIEKTLKVLLLEDMPTDRELIKRQVLKIAPNAVLTVAATKSDFLDKLNWMSPDVILADYRLPDFNGLEALLYIREKMPHVPFVFITGTLNDEEKVAEAVLKGASGYLLKENLPQLPERLEAILRDSQARYQTEEALRQQARRKNILIQKLQALLEKSEPFREKEAMEKIIHEILEDHQNQTP